MKYVCWIGLLLLIAVGAISMWRCPHIFRRLSRAALHLKYSPSPDITFRGIGMQGYNSHGPHGSRVDTSPLKSSDCVYVNRAIYRFPSAEDAEAQFNNWLRSAVRVLVTEEDSNTRSRKAVFEDKDGSDYFFNVVFKKEHSDIVLYLSSKSLEHALLFAKQEIKEFVDVYGRDMRDHPTFQSFDGARSHFGFGFCL